jgi:alpha-tubulin suppressor-like RCC1 family protein
MGQVGFAVSSVAILTAAGLLSAVSPSAEGADGREAVRGPYDVWASVSVAATAGASGVGSDTCGIHLDGSMWCWGRNAYGQLGLGDRETRHVPFQVGVDTDWRQIGTGDSHSCAIKTDHTLWCWGSNSYGELGLGDDPALRLVPTQVGLESTWRSVSTGYRETCATKVDRTLWCWGRTGLDDLDYTEGLPVQIGLHRPWAGVELGIGYGCARAEDRSLWCWGDNENGQLGLGDTRDRGQLARVGVDNDWQTLGLGEGHTCATRVDHTLWCWGQNQVGQLGLGDRTDRHVPTQVGLKPTWRQVTAGREHTCGTKVNGTLWCWGYNDEGQVGVGDDIYVLVPTPVAPPTLWAQVSAGQDHSCAVAADHTLFCWGDPAYGQLGVGNRTQGHRFPIMVGPPNEPLPKDEYLTGVDAIGPNDAWAVGYTVKRGRTDTLAMHWDGSAWTQVRTPGVAQNSRLDSVSMLSPNDVWAVGIYDASRGPDSIYDGRTLIEHWDGTTWAKVASGDPSGILRKELLSVTAIAPDDVWAAGYRFYDDEEGAISLTEHWNGKHWSWVPSGIDGSGTRRLFGVAATSPSDVWAVGDDSARGFTQHWDGSAFARVDAPGKGLLAVTAISPADAWAVGRSGTLHWDGTAWTEVDSPSIGALRAVSANGSSDVWALSGTHIEHWDGTAWTEVTSPGVGVLRGVVAESVTDAWAVGSDGDDVVIEHWDGAAWTVVS